MSTEYHGYEVIESEGFMQPKKYRVRFQCAACGHQWTGTYKAIPSDDPPCPNKYCEQIREAADVKARLARLEKMLAEGSGPAHIGQNVKVKAIDQTAEIVMEDHKLTNLRDDIRPGESMVPKLPGPMQAAADSFFSGNKTAKQGVGGGLINAKQAQLLGRRALAGAFRNSAVTPAQVMGTRKAGESPLTLVRHEQLQRG